MSLTEYKFVYKDKYSVSGKLKLCWTCIKQYEEGFMVFSPNKLRMIFFCKDCLEKAAK